MDQAITRQTEINTKVDSLNTKIFELESKIVETRIGDGTVGELGPLKYLSSLTGIPMDEIINYLLLIIIFVFDPLAISLVVAANFAFEKLKPKEKKLYVKQENWIDENQVSTEPKTNVIKTEEKPKPKREEPSNRNEIERLEKEKIKIQNSDLIEKRRNEQVNKIQSQINQLRKEDDDKTITY